MLNIKNMSDKEFSELCELSKDFNYVKNNLDKCWIPVVINNLYNNSNFTEEFILMNLNYFNPYLKDLLLKKKDISDDFLSKIFTK